MQLKTLNPKKTAIFLILICSLATSIYLGFSLLLNAAAMTRTPGIKVGEWFEYQFESFLNASDLNATYPENWPSGIAQSRIEILKVSNGNITLFITAHSEQGGESNETAWINVQNGEGNFIFIAIAANLTAGKNLYEGPLFEGMKINYTQVGYYAGNFREVNCFILDSEDVQFIFSVPYTHFEVKWDQETGICVEQTYRMDNIENGTSYYHAEIHIKLVKTNAWHKREWSIGVNVGDWWKYGNITCSVNSSSSENLPILGVDPQVINETEWELVNVTEISGKNITLKIVSHFKNQTERTDYLSFEISNTTEAGFILVASNLNVGDFISINGPTVTAQETRNSLNVKRRTNILNVSEFMEENGVVGKIEAELVWDKPTGVLISTEIHMNLTAGPYFYLFNFHMNLIDTNLWGTHKHLLTIGDKKYNIITYSNASVEDLKLNLTAISLTLNVKGPNGTIGFFNVTIPKSLLWCDSPDKWKIYVDEKEITSFAVSENETCTFIYFECQLSNHQVRIVAQHVIPEFSTIFLALTIATSTLLIYVTLNKNKYSTKFLQN